MSHTCVLCVLSGPDSRAPPTAAEMPRADTAFLDRDELTTAPNSQQLGYGEPGVCACVQSRRPCCLAFQLLCLGSAIPSSHRCCGMYSQMDPPSPFPSNLAGTSSFSSSIRTLFASLLLLLLTKYESGS